MTEEGVLAYCCAPGVVWVKDAGQTILAEQEGERGWILRGVEAATWDLLTLGYPFEKTVRFLSVLLEVPMQEARNTLRATLQEWEGAGIVCATGSNGRG
jgi:hypothetical protein